jgi:hypothetical protein
MLKPNAAAFVVVTGTARITGVVLAESAYVDMITASNWLMVDSARTKMYTPLLEVDTRVPGVTGNNVVEPAEVDA